jgi:hypothetical protein
MHYMIIVGIILNELWFGHWLLLGVVVIEFI